MARVLVTGGSGFIGSRTLEPLRRTGFEVHSFGRSAPAEATTHHTGDLFDRARVRALLERVAPTHILHCAWEVTHGTFWHDPRNLDWVAATLDLARAAAAHGVKRFVGLGTCAEYDWSDGGPAPRKEHDALAPRELYGVAKDCTQRLLARFFDATDCSFAWARMFHLFGAGEHPARFVPSLVIALREGREARCRHGQLTRDFIAVEDAGAAIAAIVAAPASGPVNVASGSSLTLAELAGVIGGQLNGAHLLRIETNPTRDPLGMTADVTRLRGEVGFVPEMETRERLARYVAGMAAA
jgi:nucleoside-diphosphate-sugar epimerase